MRKSKSTTTRTKNKLVTVINFILDQSGSMDSCKDGTISGFNEYIHSLRQRKGDVRLSLTLFDTATIEKRHIDAPIKSIEPLTEKTYQPNMGTPLYDAAVDSIEATYDRIKEMKPKPMVINVIMTDGEENASTRHDQECLSDLQKQLTNEGNWTFVFLGANQDSYANASKFGTLRGNTGNFQSTNQGAVFAFSAMAEATNTVMDAALNTGQMQSANFLGGVQTGVKGK